MEKVSQTAPGGTDEVAALRRQHQSLEQRLAALDRHLSLTAAEQVERAQLKKEKLRVKDRLAALLAESGRGPGSD